MFLAANHGSLSRLSDAARVALAWGSIVDDVKEGRLNIDLLQKTQAEKELRSAEEVLRCESGTWSLRGCSARCRILRRTRSPA